MEVVHGLSPHGQDLCICFFLQRSDGSLWGIPLIFPKMALVSLLYNLNTAPTQPKKDTSDSFLRRLPTASPCQCHTQQSAEMLPVSPTHQEALPWQGSSQAPPLILVCQTVLQTEGGFSGDQPVPGWGPVMLDAFVWLLISLLLFWLILKTWETRVCLSPEGDTWEERLRWRRMRTTLKKAPKEQWRWMRAHVLHCGRKKEMEDEGESLGSAAGSN